MREQGVAIIAMRVGRILDKIGWTKALGEVATVVYVDCNEDIELSKHDRAVGHETSGQYLRRGQSATN
jgi:hypothetical protein